MALARELAGTVTSFMNASPGMPAWLLYFSVALIPVTLLHELGHALAARRLLGGAVQVRVGTAGRLASVRLGQITVAVRAISHPGRIQGVAFFDATRATARDLVVVALAGPAASLLGFALALWAYASVPAVGVVHNLLWCVTLASLGAVLNIIPFEFQERRGGPLLRTDGLVALKAARIARANV